MRAAIVGCGVISRAYARKFAELDYVDLVACADLDPDRAKTLAAEFSIPRVVDADKITTDDDVDLLVNLTIPAAHFDVSLAGLQSGKHVYSEKPLAFDRTASRALVTAAAAGGRRLGCAPDTFLGAGLQTCRKLIDDGAIGVPVAANAFMLGSGPESWHPSPQFFYEFGAGPLFDVGPYYVTALVFLLGPVARVTGSSRITHPQRTITSEPLKGSTIDVEVPTHVAGCMEMAAGPVATLVCSFDVQASRLPRIEVYGTEGTLAVPDPNTFGGPVLIGRRGSREWEEIELTHPHATQSRGIGTADMAWALRSGRAHRCSGELACHVTDVMESIVQASQDGAHIALSTTCDTPAPLPVGLHENGFDD